MEPLIILAAKQLAITAALGASAVVVGGFYVYHKLRQEQVEDKEEIKSTVAESAKQLRVENVGLGRIIKDFVESLKPRP